MPRIICQAFTSNHCGTQFVGVGLVYFSKNWKARFRSARFTSLAKYQVIRVENVHQSQSQHILLALLASFFLTKAKPFRAKKLQNRTLQGIPRYPFSSCIRIWLQDTHYKFSGHIFVRTITHLPRHANSDKGRSTQLQGPRTQFVWPVSEL